MDLTALASVLVAYFLGAIPFGYLIYRQKTGEDIRATGSGNIGATNVARVAGKGAGIVTLLLDTAKGYAAVMIAGWLTGGRREWMAAAAVAVLVGHMFPVFLKFRGGKGVAAALGVYLAMSPWAVAVALLVFAAVLAIWRYVSLGSILACAVFPAAAWYIYHPPGLETIASVVAGALIIVKHSANIQRLIAGQEHRFGASA